MHVQSRVKVNVIIGFISVFPCLLEICFLNYICLIYYIYFGTGGKLNEYTKHYIFSLLLFVLCFMFRFQSHFHDVAIDINGTSLILKFVLSLTDCILELRRQNCVL